MKIIHYINVGMWLVNALVWVGYVHAPSMALFSMFGVLAAAMLARLHD